MKHNEIWYACQMMLYELRLAYRMQALSTGRMSSKTPANMAKISVPWEIRS